MEISDYNRYFSDNFTKIKENRAAGFPVFAFEHGLNKDQINDLFNKINSSQKFTPGLHRLVWIVCCTEIGYVYEGTVYWNTFNKKIPFLDRNHIGYKEVLRDYFIWFEKSFNGIVPQGNWANHFVNISHPITHSIMPKQFQKSFVRDLSKYGRYADVNTIYQYMYYNCNSIRFKKFLENDHLAKLFLNSILNFENKNEIIQNNSLDRIVSDLETEDADFKKNINTIRKIYVGNKTKRKETLSEFKTNLYLKFDTQGDFKLFINLPSFRTLPQFVDLTQYRLRFTGSPVLLRGDQLNNDGGNDVLLTKLAHGEEDFCYFLQIPSDQQEHIDKNEKFKDFIKSEIKFLNEETLLFNINEDGVGEYLEDKTLEVDSSYVVLSRDKLSYVSNNNKIEYIFKNNFHIYKFKNDNEENLSKSFLALCKITSSSKITFRPIGTIDRGKNKNFYEFFIDENPIFMIDATSDVIKCEIEYNDQKAIISIKNRHEFFELQNLKHGVSNLYITPYSKSPAGFDQELPQRKKLIMVRPAKLNVGFENKSVFFNINQNEPTLQNFWENKLDFQIIGPPGFHAKLTIILYNDDDEEITKKEILEGRPLPVNKKIWIEMFDQIKSQLSNQYLSSNKIRLELDAFELGKIFKEFENIQYPLRLVVVKKNKKTYITVKNDTDLNINDSNVKLSYYLFSFEKPFHPTNLFKSSIELEKHTLELDGTGGCYFIQMYDKSDNNKIFSDIISVSQKIPEIRDRGLHSLQNLQVKDIDLSDFENMNYETKFQILHYWNQSKIIGENLTFMKMQYIFDKILDIFYKHFYSVSWYNALLENKDYELKINSLIRNLSIRLNSSKIVDNKMQIPFKNDLVQIISNSVNPQDISYKFYELCIKRNICNDPKLISFSLHLAFEPFNIYKRYGKEIPKYVRLLFNNNDLSRSGKILHYVYSIKKLNKFTKIPEGVFFD